MPVTPLLPVVLAARRRSVLAQCIYLDDAATTRMDPRVLQAMHRVLADGTLGNAHARQHAFGTAAHQIIKSAREQVAHAIDASADEIVFTSGATESNNLALRGLARHLKSQGRTHIITSAVEHKSVLEPLRSLMDEGFQVSILPVKPCGMLEASEIARAIRPETGLVSVQSVNNEVGTVQPLHEIAEILVERKIYFHTDAAQALGKLPFSVRKSRVNLASFSAHKVYGPQGIGALYVNRQLMELMEPMQRGGGQESGLRSGTSPTALCAAFGEACRLVDVDRSANESMRRRFLERISCLNPVVHGHRHADWRVPNIVSIRFPGIENEVLVMELPGLAVGIGSACNSRSVKGSHVIEAITGSQQAALETIRLSFGRMTSVDDLDEAADRLIATVLEIRDTQGAV
jgi:cysteine desulfurase